MSVRIKFTCGAILQPCDFFIYFILVRCGITALKRLIGFFGLCKYFSRPGNKGDTGSNGGCMRSPGHSRR